MIGSALTGKGGMTMIDREKVIKGLEILMNGCEYIHCDDCCFYISTKPTRCGLREEQIKEDALALLKEQEAKIEQLNRFVNGFSRDAIPVVRCKDCKYYDYHNGCMSWHDVNSKNDNWYCADGERKG